MWSIWSALIIIDYQSIVKTHTQFWMCIQKVNLFLQLLRFSPIIVTFANCLVFSSRLMRCIDNLKTTGRLSVNFDCTSITLFKLYWFGMEIEVNL